MDICWSEVKNDLLKRERGVCFDDVADIIRAGTEIEVLPHPTRKNQRILIVRLHGYIHAVPFVEDGTGIFLKTIYPSRELQKQYGGAV